MSNLDERLERGGAAVRRMAATVSLAARDRIVEAGRAGGRRPPIGLIVAASLTLIAAVTATLVFLGPNSDVVGSGATTTSVALSDTDLRVFLPSDTTDDELNRAVAEATTWPGVINAYGFDRDAAFAEFSEMFAGCPELVAAASQDLSAFPPSVGIWVEAGTDIDALAETARTALAAFGPVDVEVTAEILPGQYDCDSPTTDPTGEVSITVPDIGPLAPVRVTCSAELSPSFPCSALVDGDPNTTWQAPNGGIGATITLLFASPVQITDIAFANESGDAYILNVRIRGVAVMTDDLAAMVTLELSDTNEAPQQFEIRSLRTSEVTIEVTSAYPGQSFGDQAPFIELALGEITFRGRLAPDDRRDVGFPYLLIDAGRLDQSLTLDSAFDQEISVDSPERLRAFGLPDASPTAARIWFVSIPGGSDFFRGDGFEDPQWDPLPVEQGRAFIRTGPVGSSVMWETGDPGGEVVVAHALMVEAAVLIDVVSGLEKDDSGWGPRFLPEGFIELYDGPARADVERLIAQSWTDVEEGDGSAVELYLIDRGPDGGEQALNELLGFTVSELEIGATEVRGKPALVYAIGNETIYQWMETATVTVRVVIRGSIDSASVLSALVLVDQATWDAAMSDANRDRGVGPPPTVAPANTDP